MPNAAPTLSSLKPRLYATERKDANHDRLYGRKWKAAKKAYLAKHPLCVDCEQHGLIVLAEDVDHIIPHKDDKVKFWNSSNWQALCHSCHSRKTGKERKAFEQVGYNPREIA